MFVVNVPAASKPGGDGSWDSKPTCGAAFRDIVHRQHRVVGVEGVVDRRNHHANTKLTRHPRIAPSLEQGSDRRPEKTA